MKLTVLGNSGPYPKPGGACSGYLIESKDTKILLECGNGVLSRLQMFCKPTEIDAIILSHLHSDHMSDVLVLKYAVGIRKLKNNEDISIPLYTATDDKTVVDMLNYNGAFNIFPINDGMKINIKNLELEFKRMTHPVESYGVKIREENKVLVYSADTSYNEGLVEFAEKADLFLCEAGVLEEDRKGDTPHLSALQAGEVAQRAKVKRLLLTHFWPEYKLEKIMNEARERYSSILESNEEMKTYHI